MMAQIVAGSSCREVWRCPCRTKSKVFAMQPVLPVSDEAECYVVIIPNTRHVRPTGKKSPHSVILLLMSDSLASNMCALLLALNDDVPWYG